MLIREIVESDYPEVFSWFESRKWPLPPITGSGSKQGLMAVVDDQPVACVFLYIDGTAVADVDWIALNPKAPLAQAMEGLSLLVEHLKQMSRLSNPAAKIRALRIYTKNKKLAEFFEGKQFKKNTEYIRLLWTLKD